MELIYSDEVPIVTIEQDKNLQFVFAKYYDIYTAVEAYLFNVPEYLNTVYEDGVLVPVNSYPEAQTD